MRVSGQQTPDSSPSIERQEGSGANAVTDHACVGQGHPQSGQVSAAAVNDSREMRHLLTDFISRQFRPYRDRLEAESPHRGEIDRIIESRVNKLMEENISFEELQTVMDKAKKMDRNASMVSGTVGGLPFALASTLQATIPAITGAGANIQHPVAKAAAQGAISLAAASVIDQVGGASMKKLREDAYYLQAPGDKLHESLKVALESIDTKANLAIKNAKEAQTFTVRNAARMIAGPVAAKLNPAVEPILDTALAITGGLAAGAGTGYAAHNRRTEQFTSGPALLLGRRDAEPKQDLNQETDWFDVLQALRGANTFSTPLTNAGGRLADAGRTLLTDPLGALSRTAKGTFTASGAANVTTLTGGFAALEAGKGAAVNALAQQQAWGSFAKHAINTAGGAVVFGANAASVAVADKLVEDLMAQGGTTADTAGATETAQPAHGQAEEAPDEASGRIDRTSSQRSRRAGSESSSPARTSLTGNRIMNADNTARNANQSPASSVRGSLDSEQAQPTISGGPSSEAERSGSTSSGTPAERLAQLAVQTENLSDDDASSYHTATDASDDDASVYFTPPQSPV
ncbi:hypothetical protein [Pseudomonas abietaniphila]|uniref:Uncharacterized protein n=1 Tax=Pseudomonas abietaniphila TaxID=89065 RepID=A0A1G7RKQ0_9PSED|nr:hypothetical protein [Pseudomonas abietaniphila]SDG11328.1 hypothetical protein SAMN05216605_101178 [Pseudomonas abietaniphila]